MLILAFDIEATGLDTSNDKIIEIGAALWDTERGSPVKIYNNLVSWPDVKVSNKIKELTGIHDEDIERYGISFDQAAKDFKELWNMADYVLAHNAYGYDIPMIENFYRSLDMKLDKKPVIDTMMDLPLKRKVRSRALSSLLTEHEILNYFPHRAFADALCTVKMADRYPWDEITKRAQTPVLVVVADVTFNEKDKAKDAGFLWDPSEKIWYTRMREYDYKGMTFNFATRVIDQ